MVIRSRDVGRRAVRPAAMLLATVLLAAGGVLAGCAAPTPPISLPPEAAAPDYQLGTAYEPASEVGIVVRDRTAKPAAGIYSVCYINAFQTQPAELDAWPTEVLLTDGDDEIVFDPAWPDEALLDTSSAAQRDRIANLVDPWIRECAESGFDAVEFDNLDTYARSDGALTFHDNLSLAAHLVDTAHSAGLAAGQKNAAEDAEALRADAGFDFAVAEECLAFDECELYTAAYGTRVIAIEYSDTGLDFAEACRTSPAPASVVLRDRALVAPDEDGYVFALCDGRAETG
ncbi:endo alpha-1,4 polygalactosaminidase [Microbacterium sp. QXD-8]|uniref:Endo alpha-1,4 polygalactosaminidase n=1 Tax=Microbacterium psychrotolerans TaxID=3068321 RepID=A0ABU0Z6W5_9MICO|nr:endo alpha-1,4 polygalactosaminidase [Microbacterium sp. QXD-8]MDQ7880339.1 endo alpha-1,4 polygalactosaminidase [Microbacterium sp. QXD-8]